MKLEVYIGPRTSKEDDHIYTFLAGLNIEFDEVRGRVLGKSIFPTINEVFYEVR